ncbi:MAG TPA: thiol peroxidase [Candidatus Baltobacteraceae bacterium]|jgi:thiol peroxidase|nr:thiol peroxidase [Candidatus Baltobacteraceae bacterium]
MTVTFKGRPVELTGPQLQVGEKAPDFTVLSSDMKPAHLDDVVARGEKNALLIVVPSLDTGVCSIESQKFNARVGELAPDITPYVLSRDTPFAQARWAKEQGEVHLQFLSDFLDHSFGKAYGVEISELGLLARCVFIIGKDKTIRYLQIVPEVTLEPDYDAVIAAASKASSAVNA